MSHDVKPAPAADPSNAANLPYEEGEFSHQLVVGFFLVSFLFVILFALTQWVLR